MLYEVKEVLEKSHWEKFVISQPMYLFLQSWNYGEMQKVLGETVYRLGLYKNDALIGVAQVFKVKAKRGTYYFIPYGPLLNDSDPTTVDFFFEELYKKAKGDHVDFIRIHPIWEQKYSHVREFSKHGYTKAPIHLVSDNFWILDISKSEDQLLKEMRKNTRNLIRRAIKEKVVIEQGVSDELLEKFFILYEKTAKRHHFTPYSKEFITQQVRSFQKDNQVQIIIASHQKTLISGAIVMYYGKQAAYHHGASIQSKIPATYLMQWASIQEAKSRGATEYNFWGIVKNKPKHPWAGLSFFKQGFGGHHIELLPALDKPISWKYYLTYVIETIRKIKRGL